MNKKIIVFNDKKIRRILKDGEWWFSVVDVIGVLSESPTPRKYWEKIKVREFEDFQPSPNWGQLKMEAKDGKFRLTDCLNKEGFFGWENKMDKSGNFRQGFILLVALLILSLAYGFKTGDKRQFWLTDYTDGLAHSRIQGCWAVGGNFCGN